MSDLVVTADWHPDWNKPLWIKDAKLQQTDFEYYETGNGKSLLKVARRPLVDDSRPAYNFVYSHRGQVLTATDPTSLQTVNTYHSTNGNLLTTTAAAGTAMASMTTFDYDAVGNLGSSLDARNNATTFDYDASRRRTVTKHHNGGTGATLLAAERTTYDLNGRPWKEEACTVFSGTTITTCQMVKEQTFTKTGKTWTEKNGAGNVTTFLYDAVDRMIERADPLNRRSRFEYDPAGQMLKEIRAYGTPLAQEYATYSYSPNGQRLSVVDAKGNRSEFEYDGFDRLARWRFPHKTSAGQVSTTDYEAYQYDPNGNRIELRKRDGRRIAYVYDPLEMEAGCN